MTLSLLIMPGKPGAKASTAGNGASAFDLDTLQQQLVELSSEEDGPTDMINLLNNTKKAKLNSEERTIINIAAIMIPFVMVSKATAENLNKIKVTVEKNKSNVRLLAYHHDKLEQYTRRDNLRLFNFPTCTDDELYDKFIELGTVLGVDIQRFHINTIHKLPANAAATAMSVIVRLNNRKIRNDLLYARKAPQNTPDCIFRGVFIKEDLTQQRSKLLKFLKSHDNVEKTRTSEGRIRVSLKVDRGAGKNVTIENPDDLFKIGIDNVDITQFGYPDM